MSPSSPTTGKLRLHDAMRLPPTGATPHSKAYPRSPSTHRTIFLRADGRAALKMRRSACPSPTIPLPCRRVAFHLLPSGRPLCSRAVPFPRTAACRPLQSHVRRMPEQLDERALDAGMRVARGLPSACDARMLRGGCTSPSDSDIRRPLASNFGYPPTLCGPRQCHPRTNWDWK